jgi:Xaa-Pro aminopeptidase
MPATNYFTTLVFPLDGGITIVTHGPAEAAACTSAAQPQWMHRGISQVINVPDFPTVWWQEEWQGKKVADLLVKERVRSVGLVALGSMSAALYENIKKGLSGVSFSNATDLVDEVKMVKSEEELKLLKDAADMHVLSYETAKKAIRPGRSAVEVLQEIRTEQVLQRSEEQQIFIRFGQPSGAQYDQWSWGNTFVKRTFKPGDVIDILIESSGRGGYWYDLRRTLCIGNAPEELRKAHVICQEARRILAVNCVAGTMPGDALKASDDVLSSKLCPKEDRCAGHGQGLDLVERPLIRPEEKTKLQSGMVLSLHPTAKTRFATVSLSDNYLVTSSGTLPLSLSLLEDDEIANVG